MNCFIKIVFYLIILNSKFTYLKKLLRIKIDDITICFLHVLNKSIRKFSMSDILYIINFIMMSLVKIKSFYIIQRIVDEILH